MPLLLLLAVLLGYQVQFVIMYTPLYKTQAMYSDEHTKGNSFTLLVSNVLMDNDNKELFHARVKKYNSDVLLINEPDQLWAASIAS